MYNIVITDNMLANNITILDDLNPSAVSRKIADRMRRKRLFLNLTQEKLSQMSGVSLGSLKRFETKYKISLDNLLQLAMALDAMDEFRNLFPEDRYKSIDDVIKSKKVKERKRARNEKAN